MKTLKLGICLLDENDEIVSKRIIGTNWEVDLEQDLREKFNIHVHDEIANIMFENLKLQLSPEVIKEMLREVK
jgi:hypothetical protein